MDGQVTSQAEPGMSAGPPACITVLGRDLSVTSGRTGGSEVSSWTLQEPVDDRRWMHGGIGRRAVASMLTDQTRV